MVTEVEIKNFKTYLYENEKAPATVEKYVHAVEDLAQFLGGRELSKSRVLEYRAYLLVSHRAQTVNGYLSAINGFLAFIGRRDCCVKFLKVQRRAFLDESRELTKEEYRRLLQAAKDQGNERLYLLMQTVCSTGIRISELPYITVEAATCGRADIYMKGKCRTVLLQKELCHKLLRYAKRCGNPQGAIFRTRNGRPLDRSNIWHDMKKLCREAGVDSAKVFPHNLRHLFARTFYALENNLAHLADVLGHSRVETTRIYVAVSATSHAHVLQKMRLIQ